MPGRNWTEAETAHLIEHYSLIPLRKAEAHYGRGWKTISGKALTLGLHRAKRRPAKPKCLVRNALRQKIEATDRKVTAQYGKEPEQKLMAAILSQAASDLLTPNYRRGAIRYIKNCTHALHCGIDPVWVRQTFERAGLLA